MFFYKAAQVVDCHRYLTENSGNDFGLHHY